jgi:hypothetical protein
MCQDGDTWELNPCMKLHQTKVSFSIKLAASAPSGWTDT